MSTSPHDPGPSTDPTHVVSPRTPRWVRWLMIGIAAALIVLVGMLVLGGDHGPGRHGS